MPIRQTARLILGTLLACVMAITAQAQDFETPARAAYVYDQTTGTVLLAKNADEPLPPASMSKLMTIYMAFEAIAEGAIVNGEVFSVDMELSVSQHAMDYTGSSMFLRAGERVRVEDLLRGIIVLSGNDASAVIAEALSPDGTEAGFARMMTERARLMGMTNSTFANSNGWPAAGHRMSVRDLGTLADRLITDYPTFYPLFAEREFMFDGRVPANSQNRNPILRLGNGADGLKTGHTQEAGYGLVGSAKQGDRRIIFVLTGLATEAERAQEAERVINWAFRQFAQHDVVAAGTELARANVWMGEAPTVGLSVAEDVSILLPILSNDSVEANLEFRSPIEAPIAAGDEIGDLVISPPGLPETRVKLVATDAVARGGFSVRLRTAAIVLLRKFAPDAAQVLEDGAV